MSKKTGRMQNHRVIVYVSAWSFILLAAFYSILSLSPSVANHVADGGYAQFVESLSTVTETQKMVWLLSSLIPLLLIPASLGYYSALRPTSPYASGFMVLFFCFSALGYFASIARWSLVHLNMASLWETTDDSGRESLENLALFLDSFVGNLLGTYIAEGGLAVGFALMVYGMHKAQRFPKWLISLVSLTSAWLAFGILRVKFTYFSGIHSWGEMLLIFPVCLIALGLGMFFFRQPREKKMANYKKKKKSANSKKSKGRKKK